MIVQSTADFKPDTYYRYKFGREKYLYVESVNVDVKRNVVNIAYYFYSDMLGWDKKAAKWSPSIAKLQGQHEEILPGTPEFLKITIRCPAELNNISSQYSQIIKPVTFIPFTINVDTKKQRIPENARSPICHKCHKNNKAIDTGFSVMYHCVDCEP